MARKLISFLGTNKYVPTTYQLYEGKEGSYTSSYIQDALIHICCKDWTTEDEAIIFITEKAYIENWDHLTDEERRLKEVLKKGPLSYRPIEIPDGRTEEEIWEIFDLVSGQIGEGDQVILDITHGFRSIPLLAIVILNYVKAAKNVKILGVYYGAWESRDTTVTPNRAPIFDMTPLVEMQEWAQAVNTFLRYGNSGHLRDISKHQLNPLLKTEKWAQNTRSFIESLYRFTMAINTCRGKSIQGVGKANERSIMFAFHELQEKLSILNESDESLKPLMPLLSKIEKRMKPFHGKDILQTGLATIQWCIDHDLIQQGYTALEETLITYLCIRFQLDPTKYEDREQIVGEALGRRIHKLKENKKQKEGNQEESVKENEDSNQIKKIQEIYDTLEPDLVTLANKIKDSRNDINHFGFTKEVATYSYFQENIKKDFKKLMDFIELDEQEEVSHMDKKRMVLIFSHQLTQIQEEDARLNWGVEEFIHLPLDLQQRWSNISPVTDSVEESLEDIFNWIEKNTTTNDYLLVQGEFGATYQMVHWLKKRGYAVLYSTTHREAIENVGEDSSIIITHKVSHVRYREY